MKSSKKPFWWHTDSRRPVWIEITRRPNDDIGVDLNHHESSPRAYELLGEPRKNDRVLHWDSKRGQFVGASIVQSEATRRNGSRFVLLKDFIELPADSLTLEMIRLHGQELRKIRESIAADGSNPHFPFQPYGDQGWNLIRPALSYLTAAPAELVRVLGGIYEANRGLSPLTPSWNELGFTSVSRVRKKSKSERSDAAFKKYLNANEEVTLTATGKVKAPDLSRLQASFRAHNALQNKFAQWLVKRGLNPQSPHAMDEHSADIQWVEGSTKYVAEVKSTNGNNEVSQIRKGIGQVLHYRELASHKHSGDVVAVLVVSTDPGKTWKTVCENAGIRLVWPNSFEYLSKK